jgi:DNA-binding transcriptional LysR family regulator
MNLKSLLAFVEVAERGHFGRAALQLGMTQSGLSQLVKTLEKKIGAPLIYRSTRSASLTEAGEVYLKIARELIDGHRLADQKMADFLKGDEGVVRLGFVASAALGIIPAIAAKLQEAAPGIKLSLREMTSQEQLSRLKGGEIDVGVMREIREYAGLSIVPLVLEPLKLAVPKTHLLASKKLVSLSELRSESFVMFPRSSVSFLHDHIHRLCHDAGFTPHVVEEAMQFATILGLVSSNAGIAIVPESIQAIQLPNVSFIPLKDAAAVSQLYMARRAGERASPAAKRLVGIATSH